MRRCSKQRGGENSGVVILGFVGSARGVEKRGGWPGPWMSDRIHISESNMESPSSSRL